MTDQFYYDQIIDAEISMDRAIVVISIPKYCDWCHPETGEKRAYKFVSKVFDVTNMEGFIEEPKVTSLFGDIPNQNLTSLFGDIPFLIRI